MTAFTSDSMQNCRNCAEIPRNDDEARGYANLERLRSTCRDIFFSPIAVSGSESALSDPLPKPRETMTPSEQEPFHAAGSGTSSQTQETTASTIRPKLKLTPQHFERLVRAYVSAPIFRDVACRKRGGGDVAEWDRVAVASQKNAEKPLEAKIRGIVVTESRLKGNPIRFMTNGYKDLVGNTLNFRSQSFLDSPFGEQFENDCCFRVESKPHGEGCKVSICVTYDVIDRVDGTKIFHLVNDVDVSEQMSAAVLAELAAKAEIEVADIEITNQPLEDSHANKSATTDDESPSIDWLAMADELQIESELDSIVESACKILAEIELTNCSPQSEDLLGDLERLKYEYRDFIILQTRKPHAPPPNAVPSKIGVPWISDHFEWRLHEGEHIPESARRRFREDVVGIVAKKAAGQIPFASSCILGDFNVRLQCAPLRGKSPFSGFEAWVAFVNRNI